ncbi:hypothetical protein ABZ540_23475 [Nocardia xishanensis]|uniref:hypothetical protein n=1 Tax=Nocardia xishanensis TaxID=238964 RepID=UPI0033D2FC06
MFTTVLLIEKPLSATDVDFLIGRHEDDLSFIALMHARGSDKLLRAIDDVALGGLMEAVEVSDEAGDDQPHRQQARDLEDSLRRLRAAGAEAVGQLIEGNPLDQLRAVVEEIAPDEVIVLTEPHAIEEFFHCDWASRARHKVGVPVLKLYAHSDEQKTDENS